MTHKNTLGKGNFLQLVAEDNWEYCQRVNASGVVVLIAVTKEKKLLLVEQYRPPIKADAIELPAGLVGDIDKTEDLLTAADRELLEETGYQAKQYKIVTEGPISSGLSNEIMTFIAAEDLIKKGLGGGDETENITMHEIELDAVETWLQQQIANGKMVDPKIYAALYFINRRSCRLG